MEAGLSGSLSDFLCSLAPRGSGVSLALGSHRLEAGFWELFSKHRPEEFPERGRKQRGMTTETRRPREASLLPARDRERGDPRWGHTAQLHDRQATCLSTAEPWGQPLGGVPRPRPRRSH